MMLPRMACSQASPHLRVLDGTAKGRAVFCQAPIRRGDLVAVWGGVILPLSEAPKLGPREMTQCIQVEDDFVLWTAGHRQTMADWINHSCDPNCGIAGQISLVAIRDIAPGEEVCFDYAMSSSCQIDDFDCACGSHWCRGHIGADDWRRPELQVRYRGFFSAFLARRMVSQPSEQRLEQRHG